MDTGKTLVLLVLGGFVAGNAGAQQTAKPERRVYEADRESAIVHEATEAKVVDVEAQMRNAEAQLAEAARRVAELSTRRLPMVDGRRFAFEFSGRPMLGITIDNEGAGGPVEGVRVSGITPGGAAAEAGLRAGDIITAVNKESLGADTSDAANRKLLDFMAGVQNDDTLDVEYLRNGKVASVEVTPQAGMERNFAYRVPGPPGQVAPVPMAPFAPGVPGVPRVPGMSEFVFLRGNGGWGDMEMVSLTEDLGRYFGTDKGLLVVRAPADEDLKLMDGDVLQSIDGREPKSVSHAVRILGSYQAGETLEIAIMRNKKRETLKVTMPDDRQSRVESGAISRQGPVVRARQNVAGDR